MPNLPKRKKLSWKSDNDIKPFETKGTKKNYVSDNHKFYVSKEWKTLRNFYISEFPLCKWCEEEGITNKADIVDHIKEIKDGGSKLDQSNLMSLCHKHHSQKTNWERAKRKRNEI
jgi:5-methylcytosine-specific restriction endonuclease McrA|tara:strand:- start:183 stop:527 length:345 start_codon:yes stop_codon:yes gene_type:complete